MVNVKMVMLSEVIKMNERDGRKSIRTRISRMNKEWTWICG